MNQTAIVAGGCFWGMESKFQQLAGIVDTEVGYTGGFLEDPTYRQVCQDVTGHVEAVKIEFDPALIDYRAILDAFFTFHDPTLCRDKLYQPELTIWVDHLPAGRGTKSHRQSGSERDAGERPLRLRH